MEKPLPARLQSLLANSPLRNAPFRHYYIGSLGVSLGYTMQATMAAWLMATLTPSALMVALVQTASTAPALLFGLVAGALADIVDRRKIMLATHSVILASIAILGLSTYAGLIGPGLLLVLTFVIGSGFSLATPAQQASVNELVSRDDLPRAVALGAVAFNTPRAIGPALAGAVAAMLTSGSAFLVAAVCILPLIIAVSRWPAAKPGLPGVPETLLSGVQSGLRFARHSPAMRALLIRNITFCLCGSSFWALLPVIARDQLGMGAGGFGLLSASFGLGAVAGALWIPRRLKTVSLNTVVTQGVLLWIGATLVVAASHIPAIAVAGAAGVGVAWVSVLAGLSAGMQSTAPAWVRARAVAAALVSVQASLALGSALWGLMASAAGTQIALIASTVVMLAMHALNRRYPVVMGTEAQVTTGVQLPEIAIAIQPLPNDGPVLIQLEYRIDPGNEAAFIRAIHDVEPTRRRNGAASWRVYRDVGEAGRFVERFVIASWAEYVRLRMRMTVADREIQDRVALWQREGVPVRVSRLIGVNPSDALEEVDESRLS
ncbi:MAG: MFS transporter [Burkholderiales bacterium]|nr:MFS transporter [Burkholderiales bacterium]